VNNILVLSAGRRVELVEAFQEELISRNLDAHVFALDSRPAYSAACHVAYDSKEAPRVTQPEYLDFLFEICIQWRIGLVIPTIDTELLLLATNRNEFIAKGIQVVISDQELVRVCRDKRLTADLFTEIEISSPKIYPKDSLRFPCFAKPYDGSCSIGAMQVDSRDDLSDFVLEDDKMIFMEFIGEDFSEYTIDAYYDKHGSLRSMVPRERLEVRAGEISKGITRRNEVYSYLLPRLKKIQGARGCITLQVFVKHSDGVFAAIEINPRFGGGFPLSYSAGANYPGWLIDEYLLGRQVSFYDEWEENLLMLRYDAKVLVHHAD